MKDIVTSIRRAPFPPASSIILPAFTLFPRRGSLTALVCAIIVMGMSARVANAALLRSIDAENASISGATLYDDGYSYALVHEGDAGVDPSISSTYKFAGANSLKFHLNTNNDAVKDRSQLRVYSPIPKEVVRYFSFYTYFPSLSNLGGVLFTQVWQRTDFAAIIEISTHYGSGPADSTKYDIVVKNDDTGYVHDSTSIRYTGSLQSGTWIKWTVGYKQDPEGDSGGFVKVWKDDVVVLDYTGKVGSSTGNQNDNRLYIDNYGNRNQTLGASDIYFDNIKYGETLADVGGGGGGGGSTLNPTADSYIRDGSYAGTNYGTATILDVKAAGTGYNRKSYLKFDLASVGSVSNAKLRVYGQRSEGTSPVDTAYSCNTDTWTETGITWNNAPAVSTSLNSKTITDFSQYYEFDVTSFIQGQLSGDKVATIVLVNTSGNVGALFNSREAASNKPQLLITP